ncbi:hypothetical protein, conserved [Leishmania tarentolae]|uniref:Uncharacterized protein n=1 Tax=Leishmania tarentolae TaxID=5689 RepID=A0A640KT93_LEITA|nr:hypothetical protein, conserved [Leishmania tarentolae]
MEARVIRPVASTITEVMGFLFTVVALVGHQHLVMSHAVHILSELQKVLVVHGGRYVTSASTPIGRARGLPLFLNSGCQGPHHRLIRPLLAIHKVFDDAIDESRVPLKKLIQSQTTLCVRVHLGLRSDQREHILIFFDKVPQAIRISAFREKGIEVLQQCAGLCVGYRCLLIFRRGDSQGKRSWCTFFCRHLGEF